MGPTLSVFNFLRNSQTISHRGRAIVLPTAADACRSLRALADVCRCQSPVLLIRALFMGGQQYLRAALVCTPSRRTVGGVFSGADLPTGFLLRSCLITLFAHFKNRVIGSVTSYCTQLEAGF